MSLQTNGLHPTNAGTQTVNGEILLTFDASDASIEYKIHADDRCPDIVWNANFILQEIQDAITQNHPLEILEDPDRVYVHIGHQTPQRYGLQLFTARRVR